MLKQPEGVHIPSERTVYRVMDRIGLDHRPKGKPNGITKADREAMSLDDLLKRNFHSDAPLQICITDITEIPASNGELYVSAIFDCYDLSVLGLAMETNMKADLCIQTLENALTAYPMLEGAVIHSDRGTLYDTKLMTIEELKVLIWRYFLSYWNNRRICSANSGLPPMVKRRQYYEALGLAA